MTGLANELAKAQLFVLYAVILVSMLVGMVIGAAQFGADEAAVEKQFRIEAVKSGHAEWVADENGPVTFRWKEVPK